MLLKEPLRSPEAITKTLEKFRSQITPNAEGPDNLFGCWPWTGRRNKVEPGSGGEARPGYGLITIGNNEWLAHRFSFGYFVGGHRPGHTLDHVCRNSLCVRPDHLMPMTQSRNSQLEHRRNADDLDAVLFDLLKIPNMQPGIMLWGMLKGLPVGRAIPGGEPFPYGLDGQVFSYDLGPARYPDVPTLMQR
ncbi:HNH endonuclease [Arthrobacter sp. Soil763]|uniref:HNH endonuclease n=1 Tax=Arthrobacter sp. Soil763 TaxID=1736402 RepID=UPI0019104521|nr:HNH endonuclease [Arthrobacter sp. Soil763]